MELAANTERRIQDKISSGGYSSPDDVVDRALDALENEQDALTREQIAIRDELDHRFDEMSSGQVTPVPGADAIARIRAKLDAQHK